MLAAWPVWLQYGMGLFYCNDRLTAPMKSHNAEEASGAWALLCCGKGTLPQEKLFVGWHLYDGLGLAAGSSHVRRVLITNHRTWSV